MVSSGTDESSTDRDNDPVEFSNMRNYTTLARHMCICVFKFVSVAKPQTLEKADDGQDSACKRSK